MNTHKSCEFTLQYHFFFDDDDDLMTIYFIIFEKLDVRNNIFDIYALMLKGTLIVCVFITAISCLFWGLIHLRESFIVCLLVLNSKIWNF